MICHSERSEESQSFAGTTETLRQAQGDSVEENP